MICRSFCSQQIHAGLVAVQGRICQTAENRPISVGVSSIPSSASGTEMIALQSSAWRAKRLAAGRSPAPNACATYTDAPTESALSAPISGC
jgi:hypothetical protein